jgi:hypothetical protein
VAPIKPPPTTWREVATDYAVVAVSERYSPAWVVERARRVMREIDLDPASCPMANRVVRAVKIYGRKQDGLA